VAFLENANFNGNGNAEKNSKNISWKKNIRGALKGQTEIN
jgi:hypothetical protein